MTVILLLGDKDNRDVCGLCAMDPRLNCILVSALCSMMLTHTNIRPGEPPPTCLCVRDNDRPPSYECVVWLGSMVQARVPVPARAHRNTDYCSQAAGQHDSQTG